MAWHPRTFRVASGFSTSFKFQLAAANTPPEGFAFVIQGRLCFVLFCFVRFWFLFLVVFNRDLLLSIRTSRTGQRSLYSRLRWLYARLQLGEVPCCGVRHVFHLQLWLCTCKLHWHKWRCQSHWGQDKFLRYFFYLLSKIGPLSLFLGQLSFS